MSLMVSSVRNSMPPTTTTQDDSIGGLSHLVEAASALSQLVDIAAKQEEAKERSVVSDDDEDAKKKRETPTRPREIFPQRLMAILADAQLTDVISWLPHGRSFVIIRPDVFSEVVLPKYFPSSDSSRANSTKYPSFTRKLNRWGFRQATRGPDTGAFHHPLFRRDEPALCLDMVCQKSRKRPSKTKDNNEPQSPRQQPPQQQQQQQPKLDDSPRSVPPKKRKVMEDASFAVPLTPETLQNLQENNNNNNNKPSSGVSTVSADDHSVTSSDNNNNNNTSNLTLVMTSQSQTPWIPNDPALVAATLKTREEMEKIAAAKSMLYDAYLKALNGQ